MYVFVYGILMRHASEGALLPGHRLRFAGFATVEATGSDHDLVRGGLVEVDDRLLAEFDRIEGYPRYYGRKKVYVRTLDGRTVRAWVYQMNAEHVAARRVSEWFPDSMWLDMTEQYDRLGHPGPREIVHR